MKRSGFKRPVLERTRTVHQPIPEHLRRGRLSPVGQAVQVVAKPKAHRNGTLLEMAKWRQCMLLIPGVHRWNPETTVACHGNYTHTGKGGARKADDHYSVWGCAQCHHWLDAGSASAEEKRAAFDAAMVRQIQAWKDVAADPREPDRMRRAARWALQLHGELE